jgi:hypothetical protein
VPRADLHRTVIATPCSDRECPAADAIGTLGASILCFEHRRRVPHRARRVRGGLRDGLCPLGAALLSGPGAGLGVRALLSARQRVHDAGVPGSGRSHQTFAGNFATTALERRRLRHRDDHPRARCDSTTSHGPSDLHASPARVPAPELDQHSRKHATTPADIGGATPASWKDTRLRNEPSQYLEYQRIWTCGAGAPNSDSASLTSSPW